METLTVLGRTERDEQSIPAVWQAVVEGRATAEQIAELEAQAEQDEEVASLLAAFTPMTDAQEDALTASLLQGAKPERQSPAKVKPVAAPKRTARRPRQVRWATRTFVALAAVAAAALFFVRAPNDALPSYQLEAARGDLAFRGEAKVDALPKHHPASALSIVLRPKRAVGGEVEVRTFVQKNGTTLEWMMPVEISPRRAVRVDGVVSQLLGDHRGPITLVFAIAAPGELPTASQIKNDVDGSWQKLSYELEVMED